MKRIIAILLILCTVFSVALAETTVDGGAKRKIKPIPAGLNTAPDGYSPTTGLKLSDIEVPDGFAGLAATGRYMPMLVQIDNCDGGINTSKNGKKSLRAPWGVEYTDAIYEAPLYKNGETRLTFLFSDRIPDSVGPTRSARVFHAWLREEWDCGFVHYGQQEYKTTNVLNVFKETGAEKKGVLFNGIAGASKPWKKYFNVRKGIAAPHNKNANVAAIFTLIPDEHKAANHTFLFTDDPLPEGDEAEIVNVTWGNKYYNSRLEYDEDENVYYRYMLGTPKKPVVYKDLDTDNEVTFSNIIVQFTECEYPKVNAPLPTVLGSGNADYFIGGRHEAGVWARNELTDRTVFYDKYGEELKLLPGRTLFVIMDYNTPGRALSYE